MAVIAGLCLMGIALMGCTDNGPGGGNVPPEIVSENDQEAGHLDNPDWGGAEQTEVTYEYTVNRSSIISGKATLSWQDDHSGSDGTDIYDIFELTVICGGVSDTLQADTGNIMIAINGTEEDGVVTGMGETLSITVRCIKCGSYNEPPFIGPFLRTYDLGNDFSLDVEYDYVLPVE